MMHYMIAESYRNYILEKYLNYASLQDPMHRYRMHRIVVKASHDVAEP